MNEFTVRLDLAKGKARQQQTVFVRQGDMNATTIVATIYDHGAAAATSGMTARFSMRLPNGTEYYRKAASLSGNVATVALDETQAASVAGRTDVAYFQLLQGTTVVASTESFTIVVLPDALADAEVAESYDSAIQDAIDALDAAVEQMPSTVEDVLADHPEWTTTVQDGSITKAKLATDLARDRERLLYRLANMLTNALPEGETATATDAAKTPVAGLALYGRSTQDGTPTPSAPVPIVSVTPDSEGNISLWARGRNLLPMFDKANTQSGITFTPFYEDGLLQYVSLSGTSTARARSTEVFFSLPNGTYTFSIRNRIANVGAYVRIIKGSSTQYVDLAEGSTTDHLTFTVSDPDSLTFIFDVRNAGITLSNLRLYPQIEAGSTATPYQPYTATVTPVPLDGHELRSLPDGTRDELTVGADGRVTLVQRVGHVVLDGSSDENYTLSGNKLRVLYVSDVIRRAPNGNTLVQLLSDRFVAETSNQNYAGNVGASIGTEGYIGLCRTGAATTVAAEREWLALNPTTVDYPLATPVTHDLGYVAAVPLCGPDLTAQAIPTAPFALTYERDLNATLARLESAIANLV